MIDAHPSTGHKQTRGQDARCQESVDAGSSLRGGQSPRAKIKVANPLKFAKDELPCFIDLFHHTKQLGTQIYIRHFWTELIERALKRARQASVERRNVHKIWMEVRFSPGDNHSNEDLISWICHLRFENLQSTTVLLRASGTL